MRRFRDRIADNWAAVAILVLYMVLATAYNLANPLFEAPDELLHYDFVRFLQRQGRLPVVDPTGPETEYHQPPLYYAVTALVTAPFSQGNAAPQVLRNPFWGYEIGRVGHDNKNQYLHDPARRSLADEEARAVHLTRTLSTVFGLGTVAMTYWLARSFVSKPLALAAMAIVAFTPNFLLTSGAVTNDSLVILLSTATGLVLIALVARESPPPLWVWAGLGALLGLGMLTKLSAWPLVPLTAGAVALLAWRLHSWRLLLGAGAILIASATIIGGWWVVRNLLLYGEPTGLESMWAVWGVREPPTWRTYLTELGHFRTTFWANFGYGNIPLPGWVYTLIDLFAVVGVAGLLLALVRRRPASLDPGRRNQLILLGVWVALTTAALLWYLQRTIAVTGRQLYPVLPVIALGLVRGWAALVPRRWERTLAAAIVSLMLALAVGALLGALLPAYRPAPRLTAEQVAQTRQHRLDWQLGDVATLLGYDLSPTIIDAGEEVTVTFYWQPLRTPDRNYTLFVHLIGEENEAVGARDTYPGLGNDPTQLWVPGEIIVDAIPVPVKPAAKGPILLDVEAGLYDLETGERLPIRDAGGHVVTYPVIGMVKLAGNERAQPEPAHALEATFEGGLNLRGYDLEPATPEPGSALNLTLYWSPSGPLAVDYTTFVHVVDQAGAIVAQGDGPPRKGRYPTTAWSDGEYFGDTYTVLLPFDLAPGAYGLSIGLYDPHSGARLALADGGDQVHLERMLVGP